MFCICSLNQADSRRIKHYFSADAPLTPIVELLLALIAKHGHMRRVSGPLVVMVWQRVRAIATQVAAVMARMQAGTLRRYPHRRSPAPSAAPRRPATPSALPEGDAWLVGLIQETAVSAVHLRLLLADPDLPALLQTAPQLRRALRPLCRMLGVKLPPQPPPDPPNPLLPLPSRESAGVRGETPTPQEAQPSPHPPSRARTARASSPPLPA
jgi:hypothetical protein